MADISAIFQISDIGIRCLSTNINIGYWQMIKPEKTFFSVKSPTQSPLFATRWQHSGQSFPVVQGLHAVRPLVIGVCTLLMESFALIRGPSNPGLATVGLCKFYKVNSLAVATRISHNYQVLLA